MVWSEEVGFEEAETDASVCAGDEDGGFSRHDVCEVVCEL